MKLAYALVVLLALTWVSTAHAQSSPAPEFNPQDVQRQAPDVDASHVSTGQKKPWFKGTTEAQRRKARDIFLEGNRLIGLPAFAEAADQYRAALRLWDHPSFHYNLAIAQINLLQQTDAYQSFVRALRYGELPLGEDIHRRAQNYLKSLREQLLQIDILCVQAGVEISIDGQVLFTGPGRYQGMLSAGNHQLVATRDGHMPYSETLRGRAGSQRHVNIHLRMRERIVATRLWDTWKPWAVVAGGALLVGAGVLLDLHSSSRFREYDRDFDRLCAGGCDEGQIPQSLADTLSAARTEQTLAVISYAAGGVVVAAGAVMLYLNRERFVRVTDTAASRTPSPEKDHSARTRGAKLSRSAKLSHPARRSSLTVMPSLTPSSAGLHLGFTF